MANLLDIVRKGATDRSVTIRIIDSGDGTPETGVVYNTSGIDLWYRREGAAKTSITEATLSALTDAHSDGGFLHIGDGEYRLDLPDAAFASGANHVDVGGTVTGMIVIGGRIRLVNYDPEDAVRLGLTALPNANAEAAGGLFTRGTGAGQINQQANGQIDANLARWLNVAPLALRDQMPVVDADEFQNTPAGAYIEAVIYPHLAALVRKDTAFYNDNLSGVIALINADFGSGVGSYDPRTDSQEAIRDRGDSAWVTGTALDAAGVRAAVGLASANLDIQLGDIPTVTELTTEISDALTVDVIADSVAADGSRPTIAQALLMITRFLMEREVVSTTVTVNKEDGTTSSMTFTLDSATAPTTITRAS